MTTSPENPSHTQEQEELQFQRIGQKIREAREAAGLKQEELGEMIKQSPIAISRWETAKRRPSVVDLMALAEQLHKSIDYFVSQEITQDSFGKQMQQLAQRLPEAEKQELLDMAEYKVKKNARNSQK